MAVIVQNNPYACLMRKIGYSVGLELLLERITYLTDLYCENKRLSVKLFADLVHDKFERKGVKGKTPPYIHFGEIYKCLNLLWLTKNEAYPLYNLDALSILRRYLGGDDVSFQTAAKAIIAQAILEADGDVFLNALQSEFSPTSFTDLIKSMIKYKRDTIAIPIKSQAVLKRIYQIISIENFEFKPKNEILFKMGRRTELLVNERRKTPLTEKPRSDIIISEDYPRKVLPTRKGWAVDLNLVDKKTGQLNSQGQKLLRFLDNKWGFKKGTGFYVFWPYSVDLLKLRIKPENIGASDVDSWLLLCTIANAMGEIEVKPYNDKYDYTELINLLREFAQLYRSGNIVQGSIRHQLPLYIAQPCIVGLALAKLQSIPPLPMVLDAERHRKIQRVQKIIIRGTEGGLSFPKLQ